MEKAFALLIIDLDRFKMVNDTYGHTTGDELLKQVGARLSELAGPKDLVARLGGDEFAFIKAVHDYETDAGALAERITIALSRPFPLSRATLQICASIGVALGGRDANDATSLMKAADLALYAAKSADRGRHNFYAPAMSEKAMRRMRIETGLRSALVNDELSLVYQPIVSIANEQIHSFEALLRWRRKDGAQIGPAEFIPVAEEIGVIGEFGAWALRRACSEIAALPGSFHVSVNCSPLQLQTVDYPETVRWALMETGLPAHRLTIEITESMLIKDRERILEQLNTLRALGVEVSIDDFGTGYSCLSYLEIYPISALKIDRQFVNKIGERPEARDTLRAIVDLATSFGMRTDRRGRRDGRAAARAARARLRRRAGLLFRPSRRPRAFRRRTGVLEACRLVFRPPDITPFGLKGRIVEIARGVNSLRKTRGPVRWMGDGSGGFGNDPGAGRSWLGPVWETVHAATSSANVSGWRLAHRRRAGV